MNKIKDEYEIKIEHKGYDKAIQPSKYDIAVYVVSKLAQECLTNIGKSGLLFYSPEMAMIQSRIYREGLSHGWWGKDPNMETMIELGSALYMVSHGYLTTDIIERSKKSLEMNWPEVKIALDDIIRDVLEDSRSNIKA